MNKKSVLKWWKAWNYQKIEEWLEKMEVSGYRLDKVSMSGLVFDFIKTEPQKARYCIDFSSGFSQEYFNVIKDEGWQVFEMGSGWFVFRKEYTDNPPQLYTDYDSLIERNKRLLLILSGCFTPVFVLPIIWMNISSETNIGFFSSILIGIIITALILYVFSMVRLIGNTQFFKKKRELSKR